MFKIFPPSFIPGERNKNLRKTNSRQAYLEWSVSLQERTANASDRNLWFRFEAFLSSYLSLRFLAIAAKLAIRFVRYFHRDFSLRQLTRLNFLILTSRPYPIAYITVIIYRVCITRTLCDNTKWSVCNSPMGNEVEKNKWKYYQSFLLISPLMIAFEAMREVSRLISFIFIGKL